MGNETVTEEAIDLNRGISKRTHANGVQVCMYKDSPGLYYDVNANELTDEFAAEAGFDIKHQAAEKDKLDKLSAARLKIEKEFSAVEGEVVATVGRYEVICFNERQNKFNVCEKGSKKPKNRDYLTKEQALSFAKSLKGGNDGS